MSSLLLQQGADPNFVNFESSTLISSIKSGSIEMVKLLIKYGVNVNQKGNSYDHREKNFWIINNRTPLMAASNLGNLQIVKLLVEAGADINSRDDNGYTSLHHAAYMNNSNILEYLVKSDLL